MDVSARRITSIGRSARLAALHVTAGVSSVKNQYLRSCALLLGRALRAYKSTVRARLRAWLTVALRVPDWAPPAVRVELEGDVVPFMSLCEEEVETVHATRRIGLLPRVPKTPIGLWSIAHATRRLSSRPKSVHPAVGCMILPRSRSGLKWVYRYS